MAREVEAAGRPLDGEQLAVGRVARGVVGAVPRSQALRLAAGRGNEVDVADELDVPVLGARRRERDALPVRSPRRLRVLEVALRELPRFAGAVGGDDEDVASPVADPADTVQLELQPPEPPRLPLLVFLLVVRLVGHAGREGDLRSVRRPRGLTDVVLDVRQALGLAARGWNHVELPLRLLVTPLGDERQPLAVRRPARLRVVLPSGESPWRLGAVRLREPDRLAVLVLVLVDRPDDVGNVFAARPQARIGDPRELVDVLRPHPSH